MYKFYLGEILLPVAPSKLDLKINNRNKTVDLINDTEINILKQAGLSEFDFEFLIPQVAGYPFVDNNLQRASYYLDELERLKVNREPFYFKVVRTLPDGTLLFDTEKKVSLEDYTVKESSEYGFDLMISVKLKEYRDYGTKTVNFTSETTATVETPRPSPTSPAPKKTPKTYAVQRGDSLWKIAKKFYGDGSQWKKIYNANKSKIKDPNKVYPGQVLIIPV
jgi:LysM repeat protein